MCVRESEREGGGGGGMRIRPPKKSDRLGPEVLVTSQTSIALAGYTIRPSSDGPVVYPAEFRYCLGQGNRQTIIGWAGGVSG